MRFINGQKIKALFFSEEVSISAGGEFCDEIIVSMQNGQMAEVPWFDVYKEGKIISKWNGAALQGVTLLDEEDEK